MMSVSCIFTRLSRHQAVFLRGYTTCFSQKLKFCPSAIADKKINTEKWNRLNHEIPPIATQLVKNFSKSSTVCASKGHSHDHSKIWTLERLLSASLVGILPAAVIAPSQVLDSVAAVAVVMHMHWGIEAVVIDYVRPIIFGSTVTKIGVFLVYATSIGTLAGLFYFIFNDVGLGNAVRLLWKL